MFACIRGSLLALLISVFASGAFGQGLLERLEKRLEGVLGGDERAAPAAPPTAVESGYLGMTGDDDETGRGVKVLSVRAGGSAETAGLRPGDLVVAINDAEVKNLDDLERQLSGKVAGTKIDLNIERGGKSEVITATLRSKPIAAESPAPSDTLPPPRLSVEPAPAESRLAPASRTSLGVSVVPVTDESRRQYGLSVRQGALISAITVGSAADRAGFPVGGVVVAADGRRIEQPEDLINLVRNKRPGDELLLSYYQGGTLFRKKVRLAESRSEVRPAAAEVPRRDPAREAPREDRPLLRRLEKAIDSVAGPDRASGIPFAPVDPAASELRGDLIAEVDRLRLRVDQLERRLVELEAKLQSRDPASSDEDAQALELNPPAEIDPTVPPPRPMPPPPPKPEPR